MLSARSPVDANMRAVALILFTAFLFANVYAQRPATQRKPPQSRLVPASAKTVVTQTFTEAGVAVKFSIGPVVSDNRRAMKLLEGTHATVRFELKEAGGKALTNLRPAAWIDYSTNPIALDARGCREKVQSFLQSDFTNKADIDLNSYFILTLNHEPNISVIDPFSKVGTTRLYTLVALQSPGEDWVLSDNQTRLYVSMPQVNQVAVIDTATWKVIGNINAGAKPARLVLQNDERYLWVGNDSPEPKGNGVTVIDTTKLAVVAQLQTGAGHHEIGLTDDDRYAFITNKDAGTLTVVDVRKLARVKELKIGLRPAALAFSSLSKTLYVANEGDGDVVAVDSPRHEVLTRIATRPGLHALRLMPDGRYGFAVNRATNSVSIFDISTNKLLQAVPVGPAPDQITFTRDFAYVRSVESEFVTMINLGRLGKNEVGVTRFPSGQKAPKDSPYGSLADVIIPAPEPGAVLVANPADKMIYFYTEGMAAPMGSFQNYRRDPRALLVLNNSLRETEPGVYTATVKLPRSGHYEVPLLLDSPRLVNCFNFEVAENPALPKEQPVAIKIEPVSIPATVKVDETVNLRFKVIDSVSNQPKANLDDLSVLVFLAPGIWQHRTLAKPAGNGVYEMTFIPPNAGVYYVFFQCPSLGVRYADLPSHNVHAVSDTKLSTAN